MLEVIIVNQLSQAVFMQLYSVKLPVAEVIYLMLKKIHIALLIVETVVLCYRLYNVYTG
jgi:hypothetical protein